MRNLIVLVILATLALVSFSCSAEDPVSTPYEDLGTVEQALCPADVICTGSPAYSYSAGANIACYYNGFGVVYKPKPAGCLECCPKWGTCTPGGCGGIHYTNIWRCRTGGSCSP